jgi:alpha-beta hydrolase superfamily lysophospholipase
MPVKGLEPRQLCTDPVICDSFVRDPLTYKGGIRTRVGCEMLAAVDSARAFAARIRAPVLIQHGSEDKICSISGSRAYMTAMTGTDDKTLVDYPDLFHELFQERSHPKVVQDLLRWLDEHRTARRGAAPGAGGEPRSSKRS